MSLEIERFLNDLSLKSEKHLSPDEIESLVTEAREHLEDSIQARLELGDSPEQAEREALLAFGTARSIADEAARREPWIDRRFFVASILIALNALIFGSGQSFPDWTLIPYILLLLGLHANFMWASANARRFQVAAFAAILLPIWFVYSARDSVGKVVVYTPFQTSIESNSSVLADAVAARKFALNLRQQDQMVKAEYGRFLRGESSGIPSRIPSFGPDGKLKLFPIGHQKADIRWPEALAHSADAADRVAHNNLVLADALEAAHGTSWLAAIPYKAIDIFKSTGWPTSTAYLVLYTVSWMAGRIRPGKRPSRGGINA